MGIGLSIVTGAKDRPEGFACLLKSVIEHTPLEWELIVADASTEPIVCSDPRVKLIREWPPQGPVRGYNRGFAKATGRHVVYLNDDVEVLPGWATEAIRFLDMNPQIGMAALYFKDPCFDQRFGCQTFPADVVYANFGLCLRKTLERVNETFGNFFDTDLFMYGNDNSLCFRVMELGLGVVGVPTARVIHHRTPDRMGAIGSAPRRWDDYETIKRKYLPREMYYRSIFNRLARPLQGPLILQGSEAWTA